MNVPIAMVGTVIALRTIPGRKRTGQKLDIPGATLLATSVAALLLTLSRGSHWGFASLETLGCFALAIVLFVAFLKMEAHSSAPVVHLGLFRNRLFTGSAVAGFLIFITVGTVNLVMPFYLSDERGLAPREIGLVLTALPIALAAFSPLSGWLADRTGAARAIATVGAAFVVGTPDGGLRLAATMGAVAGIGAAIASLARGPMRG